MIDDFRLNSNCHAGKQTGINFVTFSYVGYSCQTTNFSTIILMLVAGRLASLKLFWRRSEADGLPGKYFRAGLRLTDLPANVLATVRG
jgi:hypothetical protein